MTRPFAAILPVFTLVPALLTAQGPASLPFQVGERLEYRVEVGRLGVVGRGAMWIEGPVTVRGRETMVLRFELTAARGPIKAHDRTASWLDVREMTSLRFTKSERHPLSSHSEAIEIYPESRRWVDGHGILGESETAAPLDELSFLYYLRTLSFVGESTWRFDRHFDRDRNPTTVRVVGSRTLRTPAGEFRTVQLEMRVRDPRRYRGDGLIRLDLSDDARRLLVRIESSMPMLGKTVLTLCTATSLPLASANP